VRRLDGAFVGCEFSQPDDCEWLRWKRRQAAAGESAVEPAHSKELTLARTVA
jgi:hypothetical protein